MAKKIKKILSKSPQETFILAEKLGKTLKGGEIIFLSGGLGAGKTLFSKGILYSLDYDADEVTSPSFTLVNLYRTEKFNVYHIDLWRLDENSDAAFAVGFDELLDEEGAVIIIEWAEKLNRKTFPNKIINVDIKGDGDDKRQITITG